MGDVFETPYYLIHAWRTSKSDAHIFHTCYGKQEMETFIKLLAANNFRLVEVEIVS